MSASLLTTNSVWVYSYPLESLAVQQRLTVCLHSFCLQYDEIMSKPLVTNKAIEKPSRLAQELEPDSQQVFSSDVYAVKKRPLWLNRAWDNTDKYVPACGTALIPLNLA